MDRPLLILDLDETLIHSSEVSLGRPHDFACGHYLVHVRPYTKEFILRCAVTYELAVWTSATEEYAHCIVSQLFEASQLVFFWTRERCTLRTDLNRQEPYWVKDLKKVKKVGFDLSRILMVDDSRRALERNYGNLVHVTEFNGDPDDTELELLADYLAIIAGEPDVRSIEKRGWRGGAKVTR